MENMNLNQSNQLSSQSEIQIEQLGKFQIDRSKILGAGANGTVYLGYYFDEDNEYGNQALQYLVYNNKFHRDINPNNILINDNQIKLADFGTSKMLADKHLNQHQLPYTCVGTFYFMSPEILTGKGWVPQSDIWSLGVTFYYILTKQLPWDQTQGSSFQGLYKNIKDILDSDSLFDKIDTHYSQTVKTLIKQMLIIDLDKRMTWDQLIKYPLFKKELEYDRKISNYELVNPKIQSYNTLDSSNNYVDKQLLKTFHHFSLKNEDILLSENNDPTKTKYIEKLSRNFNQTLRTIRLRQEQKNKVNELLQFELEKSEFLISLTNLLKDSYLKAQQLPNKHPFHKVIKDNEYYMCQFLLSKRAATITEDLRYICAFKTNKGNIWIDEDLLQTFQNKNPESQNSFAQHTVLLEKITKFNKVCSQKLEQYKNKIRDAIMNKENFDISNIERPGVFTLEKIEDQNQLCNEYFDNKLVEQQNYLDYNNKPEINQVKNDLQNLKFDDTNQNNSNDNIINLDIKYQQEQNQKSLQESKLHMLPSEQINQDTKIKLKDQ
ncbi:Protein kinase-like domain [Pseudocohnilembus persalinus]|uniref:non-specific serine/threonine protein kinase n=1 Tax=Pseudocohnilembus persalinus TaxID=266149 RepID=A0A0V0QKB9_PSEPJ|nr:Protein kinase-like domain [Pseudocohnilembus persalinus]|eukprot:KRX02626.1 Protein kinase-like domain [Pseudocohnilembus persalinus]